MNYLTLADIVVVVLSFTISIDENGVMFKNLECRVSSMPKLQQTYKVTVKGNLMIVLSELLSILGDSI